jgi:pSer/pThr/pTyr-binding forkhead associated (FHA) protein
LQDHHVSRESATEHAYLIIDGRREVALSKPLLTLGRSVENDIILEQAGVSRNHAQLRRRQQRWVLFDLNSSGGTFVNGERIFEAALQTGDVISMATAKLIFGEEQGGAGQQPQSAPIVDRTRPLHQDS